MKKLLLLFLAILLSFAFIPVQNYSETSENRAIQEFIPQGKINFSEIESVEKSAINNENETKLTFVDIENGNVIKYLSEKTRIKSDIAYSQNEYLKIVKLKESFIYDIEKNSKIIEFRSTTKAYPDFSLNTEENKISFDHKTYVFSSKMTINHTENAFESTWSGFVYSNGKSKVVLAKLKDNRMGILIQQPTKKPQVFIENELK
ncbi:hypothetical protein [Zunongwangia sp. HGR-M22]|uniref:hypothetical protein n=1 Tax=Zunongwangia sp. HGR-M22 TaxID=3015168 RepID=UPI0022DDD9FF|nr:hypothetical protein [Zunongwangia sp. HGR-M22]WBL25051.1 hypothetical protein PBT91_14250 [Zunongwangia sp. HGR-M22]